MQESKCPECGCESIGMDTIYAKGACRFCQKCSAKGPRVAVSVETLYADQVILATSAWNEWAEGEELQKLTLPEGGCINDTRLSG
jgi:hypothetical protein